MRCLTTVIGLALLSGTAPASPKGGSVEHMRVSLVQPGDRLVLTGALGPLIFQGVAGTLDVHFEKTSRGTLVTMDYRAAGFAYGNAEKLAPLVDQVLAEQFDAMRPSPAGRHAPR